MAALVDLSIPEFVATALADIEQPLWDGLNRLGYADGALQQRAWRTSLRSLQEALGLIEADDEDRILLEFEFGRIGWRADVIIIYHRKLILIEFKDFQRTNANSGKLRQVVRDAIAQVLRYKYVLESSHSCTDPGAVVAVVCVTAKERDAGLAASLPEKMDGVHLAVVTEAAPDVLASLISKIGQGQDPALGCSASEWSSEGTFRVGEGILAQVSSMLSHYTARHLQVLGRGSDDSLQELYFQETMSELRGVCAACQSEKRHALVLVSGVPGSGKTLVALQLLFERLGDAVFVTGNGPLCSILIDQLSREADCQQDLSEELQIACKMKISPVHTFKKDHYAGKERLEETILIYDEAQRVWDAAKQNRPPRGGGPSPYDGKSEAELLLDVVEASGDWGVVVGLIGCGQEIHDGEAGVQEWFTALEGRERWTVYGPSPDNVRGLAPQATEQVRYVETPSLFLGEAKRQGTAAHYAAFVDALLEGDAERAKQCLSESEAAGVHVSYCRSLDEGKEHLRSHCPDNCCQYGMAFSSGCSSMQHDMGRDHEGDSRGYRWLAAWFNESRATTYSSNSLTKGVSEFEIQGLELDHVLVGWGADLLYSADKGFIPRRQHRRGTVWRELDRDQKRRIWDYRLNSYRVLLTRGRAGCTIVVPPEAEFDPLARFLEDCGIAALS